MRCCGFKRSDANPRKGSHVPLAPHSTRPRAIQAMATFPAPPRVVGSMDSAAELALCALHTLKNEVESTVRHATSIV